MISSRSRCVMVTKSGEYDISMLRGRANGTTVSSMIRPGRYRHYKGREYEVIGEARHSETEEPFVVYRALYGEKALWIRPLAMFRGMVTVDGRTVPRFQRLTD